MALIQILQQNTLLFLSLISRLFALNASPLLLHIAQTLIEHRSDFKAKKKFHFEVENDTDVDYGPLPIVVAVLLASCG